MPSSACWQTSVRMPSASACLLLFVLHSSSCPCDLQQHMEDRSAGPCKTAILLCCNISSSRPSPRAKLSRSSLCPGAGLLAVRPCACCCPSMIRSDPCCSGPCQLVLADFTADLVDELNSTSCVAHLLAVLIIPQSINLAVSNELTSSPTCRR